MEGFKLSSTKEQVLQAESSLLINCVYGLLAGGLASRLFLKSWRKGFALGFGLALGYSHSDIYLISKFRSSHHSPKKEIQSNVPLTKSTNEL
jgi:hypothetical protein